MESIYNVATFSQLSFKAKRKKSLLLYVQYSSLMHYDLSYRLEEEMKKGKRGETWRQSYKRNLVFKKSNSVFKIQIYGELP